MGQNEAGNLYISEIISKLS